MKGLLQGDGNVTAVTGRSLQSQGSASQLGLGAAQPGPLPGFRKSLH